MTTSAARTGTHHRTVNGTPYTFTPNPFGWGVCPAASPTDRFHRSYQVYCSPDGTPRKCTCPDCVHRGNWCKHLREVEAIRRETDSAYNDQLHETAVRCGVLPSVEARHDGFGDALPDGVNLASLEEESRS